MVGCFFWFDIFRATLAFRYYLVCPLEQRLKPAVFLLPRDEERNSKCLGDAHPDARENLLFSKHAKSLQYSNQTKITAAIKAKKLSYQMIS